MSILGNQRTSVSALMGTPILDESGRAFGCISEFAVSTQTDATRVQALVVRKAASKRGDRPALVLVSTLKVNAAGRLQIAAGREVPATLETENEFLLLERDLLDQQIIDVHGHKVVRVNDVDLVWETPSAGDLHGARDLTLRIAEVEVGIRGAVRRLLKGLPMKAVDRVACRVQASVIPWDFVDLIDRDPARRVRLKIEQDRLAKMHPSDLADILEELAPKERQALFSSLDEEVAAEALEEVELKTQKTLIESLDSERVAGIIEEMDPGAAADLLSELSEERSDAILEEMNEKERQEVEDLLEAPPDSAAGLMTTEYVAVSPETTTVDVLQALEEFEGDAESITDIFLIDAKRVVVGVVPISKLIFAGREDRMVTVATEHVVSAAEDCNGKKVAELFDKYNLRCLPVLNEEKQLVGVVHAEDVIAWLRTRQ